MFVTYIERPLCVAMWGSVFGNLKVFGHETSDDNALLQTQYRNEHLQPLQADVFARLRICRLIVHLLWLTTLTHRS